MSIQQTLHEIAKFQFILSEGRKGYHLIFSPEMIREAFAQDQEKLKDTFQLRLDDINKALNHTFSLSTFEEKRDYIHSLTPDIQHLLVYGYFQLLEGENSTVH